LVREALDDYLARQEPLDKQALREQSFGAWLPEGPGPSLPDLRNEERHF
jgi:hypothetical protein